MGGREADILGPMLLGKTPAGRYSPNVYILHAKIHCREQPLSAKVVLEGTHGLLNNGLPTMRVLYNTPAGSLFLTVRLGIMISLETQS